jgi:hypothetical protein
MNLAELTGNRYKIFFEESWYVERPEVRSPDRILYERILCEGGAFIAVVSLDPIVFNLWTPRRKNATIVWEAIKDSAGVRADFHLDGEAELFFPLEVLPQVAELAKARRRKRLSEEERARLIEMGKAYRFPSKNYGVKGEENGVDLKVLV